MILVSNRPFPNCLVPLFQSETSCKTFHMKMRFFCMWMDTHFHMKGYAPRLALKKRYKATRKWSIPKICLRADAMGRFQERLTRKAVFYYKH